MSSSSSSSNSNDSVPIHIQENSLVEMVSSKEIGICTYVISQIYLFVAWRLFDEQGHSSGICFFFIFLKGACHSRYGL